MLLFFSLRKDYLGLMTLIVHRKAKFRISDQGLRSSDGRIELSIQMILKQGVKN